MPMPDIFMTSQDIILNCYHYGSKWGSDIFSPMYNSTAISSMNDTAANMQTIFSLTDRSFTDCIIENNVLFMNNLILKSLVFLVVLMFIKVLLDNYIIGWLEKRFDARKASADILTIKLFNIFMDMLYNFYLLIFIYTLGMVVWYVALFWMW